MDGKELWVNTETDEIVKVFVRDAKVRDAFYCENVKITMEIIND